MPELGRRNGTQGESSVVQEVADPLACTDPETQQWVGC